MNIRAAIEELSSRGWELVEPPIHVEPDHRLLALPSGSEPEDVPNRTEVEWSGPWPEAQVAFAADGIIFELLGGNRARLSEGGDGNDLIRLVAALATLRPKGYLVVGAAAETTSGGWDEAATGTVPGSRGVVFWNHQAHEGAFSERGDLVATLDIHWRGVAAEIEAALRQSRVPVSPPVTDDDTFTVGSARPGGRPINWQ